MASLSFSEEAGWLSQLETVLGRKLTSIEVVGGIYCTICQSKFGNKKDYDKHYSKHSRGDIEYTCVACHKDFTSYPSLRNHCYLAHVTKNKHKCNDCNKSFSKQSVLNSHIDATHRFKCASCKEQFSSKKELHTHQIIHKNDRDKPPYQCYVCQEAIESIDMCELHIDEHCSSQYPCPVCNETYFNRLDAAKHLTNHFGEVLTEEDMSVSRISEDCSLDILGGILCIYCDELFKNRIEFDTHFAVEHGDKDLVYSCNICGKQHNKYHLLANHCYNHIVKDRFECTECDKAFPRLSLLVMHTEAFHGGGAADKPYSCGDCGHAFMSARRLAQHTRVVHDTSAMRCHQEGCHKTFESLRDLVLHQRDHRAPRDTWCRGCGLQFPSLAACQRHLDVHRKMQYSCPVCNRVYHEKHLVLKHVPSHFEVVLHVCKVCGKVFNLRSRLVEHSKTHSDLRTHKCTYCNKAFIKPYHLEQHLNIHTGSRPFKCLQCPKSFASRPNCYKHMRRMHNIVNKQEIKTIKNVITTKTIASPEAPPAAIIDNSDFNSKINTNTNIESGIDSTSSEMSFEAYSFAESDDSTMDSIDPAVIEKDWYILNENPIIENHLQYTDMLPVHSNTFDTVADAAPPGALVLREYGPEFNVRREDAAGECIDLDDPYLPHIDPRLTLKPALEPPLPAWEPLITKVYGPFDDHEARLSYMNTDIY